MVADEVGDVYLEQTTLSGYIDNSYYFQLQIFNLYTLNGLDQ